MEKGLRDIFRQNSRGVYHRGYHDLTRPENSLAAAKAAIADKRAFELDLHLSKDGRLIVCHDSNLLRMTGKEGIIEQLDSSTIREEYRYSDGSCPSFFEEFLEANAETRVPIVVELKTYPGNEEAIAKKVRPYLDDLPKGSLLISFDAKILRAMKALNPPLPLGWLHSHKTIKGLKAEDLLEFDFVDAEVHALLLPLFRKYYKLGGPTVCWTVKNKFTYKLAKRFSDVMTFEIVDSAKPPKKENKFLKNNLVLRG